jgi:hypothetical protein
MRQQVPGNRGFTGAGRSGNDNDFIMMGATGHKSYKESEKR